MTRESWIDIEAELDRLQKSFNEWLSHLPAFAAPAAVRALDRLALRRRGPAEWTRQFSPLVTLYPLLQAETLGAHWLPQARRANLAHLLVLIHSFLEDRYLDGELQPNRHELLFAKLVQNHATDLLLGLGPPEPLWRHLHDAVAEHAAAQAESYHPTDDDRVFEIVAGRAAIGQVAALCLLSAAGVEPERLRRARLAYDSLVVGMQWEDDIKDLDADRRSGSENLVLRRLDSQPDRKSDHDPPSQQVAAIENAFAALRRELERALAGYDRLGAPRLGLLLEKRLTSLDPWQRRILSQRTSPQ